MQAAIRPRSKSGQQRESSRRKSTRAITSVVIRRFASRDIKITESKRVLRVQAESCSSSGGCLAVDVESCDWSRDLATDIRRELECLCSLYSGRYHKQV